MPWRSHRLVRPLLQAGPVPEVWTRRRGGGPRTRVLLSSDDDEPLPAPSQPHDALPLRRHVPSQAPPDSDGSRIGGGGASARRRRRVGVEPGRRRQPRACPRRGERDGEGDAATELSRDAAASPNPSATRTVITIGWVGTRRPVPGTGIRRWRARPVRAGARRTTRPRPHAGQPGGHLFRRRRLQVRRLRLVGLLRLPGAAVVRQGFAVGRHRPRQHGQQPRQRLLPGRHRPDDRRAEETTSSTPACRTRSRRSTSRASRSL